jgi:hypothetical protein
MGSNHYRIASYLRERNWIKYLTDQKPNIDQYAMVENKINQN